MDVEAKVALITGASSGIGAATAIELAGKGIRLTITGRNPDRLEGVAEECQHAGLSSEELLVVTGDVRDDEFVKSLVQKTLDKFNRLDILVNNAGAASTENTVLNGSMVQYDTMIETNLRAPIVFTREAVPHLEKSKGCIVNVIDQLQNGELAAKNIRVNSVSPGSVPTNAYHALGMDREMWDDFMEKWKQIQPLKVSGQAKDIAKAISFLASEDARFITGIILVVDGGFVNTVPIPKLSPSEEG